MRILFVNLLLLCSIAQADFYYISYKYVVKDFQLYNEEILVSRAMKPCFGSLQKSIILQNKDNTTFQTFVRHKKEKIINFFNTLGLDIQSHDSFHQTYLHTNTTVTFLTQCFKVDFNDNFVKISALKQPNK